tara:strand:+ start:184 stop:534 length:351 start_codon:yes stop_codon:yes gene_type:complete
MKSTAKYTATLNDESEVVVPLSALTTVTLTLYDKAKDSIINGRDAQNVLNTNNVTISAEGVLVWTMQAADNAIITTTLRNNAYERHVALFQFTWSSGTKSGKHELEYEVRQINKVT